MKKAIAVLAFLDICMVGLYYYIWQTTKNRNDFSGLEIIIPETGFVIFTAGIIILTFLLGFRETVNQKRGASYLWYSLPMFVLPMLGLKWSVGMDNRKWLLYPSLLAIAIAALAVFKHYQLINTSAPKLPAEALRTYKVASFVIGGLLVAHFALVGGPNKGGVLVLGHNPYIEAQVGAILIVLATIVHLYRR